MFWEQIQFRDASPDHLHATFPGHRFDGMTGKRVTDPIRGRVSDSGRTEGWGFYLERPRSSWACSTTGPARAS